MISVLGRQYGGATWSVTQAATALVGPVLYSDTDWMTQFIPSRTLWAAFWWLVRKVSDWKRDDRNADNVRREKGVNGSRLTLR